MCLALVQNIPLEIDMKICSILQQANDRCNFQTEFTMNKNLARSKNLCTTQALVLRHYHRFLFQMKIISEPINRFCKQFQFTKQNLLSSLLLRK